MRAGWALLTLVPLLASPGDAGAQGISAGEVRGRVQDEQGRLVLQAVVTAREARTGVAATDLTRFSADFRFPYLFAGEYSFLVEALGYRPKLVTGVVVEPGRSIELEIVLAEEAPPVERVDTVRHPSALLSGSRAGVSRSFRNLELERLPDRGREVTDLTSLATGATSGLEAQGLPASLGAMAMNGVLAVPARHPANLSDPLLGLALTRSSVLGAELLLNDPDVEWAGAGGPILASAARRGSNVAGVDVFGNLAEGSLWSSGAFVGAEPSHRSLRGGFAADLPLRPDTTHLTLGGEAWTLQRPRNALIPQDPVRAQLGGVAPLLAGPILGAYGDPALEELTALTGFMRLDTRIGERNFLGLWSNVGVIPGGTDTEYGLGLDPSALAAVEGLDVFGGGAAHVGITDSIALEVRLGVSASSREYRAEELRDPTTGNPLPVPATYLAEQAIRLGSDPAFASKVSRTTFQATLAASWDRGAHTLKGGGDVVAPFHDVEYGFGSAGQYFYSSPSAIEQGEGVFVGHAGPRPSADFSAIRFGFFLQDTWRPVSGLRILAGVRWDREMIPRGEIRLNERWLELTGLSNRDVPLRQTRLGPRAGFEWNVAQANSTRVYGSVGLFVDELDPAVLQEAHTQDGRVEIRRAVGDLRRWPLSPTSITAPVVGPQLALLGRTFEPPRTTRGSLGITQQLGGGTALHVSGLFRRTDRLPRRRDLNRSIQPFATDQFGRAVYGRLEQVGQLVTPAVGSNRRFQDFDFVWALEPDGWSEHQAVTVALEHSGQGRVQLFGSYTFSSTRDNWLGVRSFAPDAQLDPRLDGTDGDQWAEGRSDLDIPHRVAAGGEIRLPVLHGLNLGGVYRYRSGYPFTPGFREGVDINGDGSPRNDPAFVPASADIEALAGEWPCLRDYLGDFVERNGCRGPGVHDVDLRLSLGVARWRGRTAELMVEAFNLLDPEDGLRDQALFLVDDTRSLTFDEAAREVTVPLRVNPGFGEILIPSTLGRWFRFGFRLAL